MDKQIEIVEWLAEGRIQFGRELDALDVAGMQARSGQWRRFIDQLLLWGAVLCSGASLIFFLAYNWQSMGHYAKFVLAEAAILLSLIACWRVGISTMAGKASLLLSSLFVGALLALVGQTYQTGADTYELFGVWAIAILIWVMLAQMAAMYLFCLALFNLSAVLYFQTFGGFLGILFSTIDQIWTLLLLNLSALVAWEVLALRGIAHLQVRWSVRIVATAVGVLMTILALQTIFKESANFQTGDLIRILLALIVYVAWCLLSIHIYRETIKDLYVLAGVMLSLIITVNAFLGRFVLHHAHAGSFLLLGMTIIASSAFCGVWLKKVAKEMQA